MNKKILLVAVSINYLASCACLDSSCDTGKTLGTPAGNAVIITGPAIAAGNNAVQTGANDSVAVLPAAIALPQASEASQTSQVKETALTVAQTDSSTTTVVKNPVQDKPAEKDAVTISPSPAGKTAPLMAQDKPVARPVSVTPPAADATKSQSPVSGNIKGTVRLVGKDNKPVSPKETIITLEPLFDAPRKQRAPGLHTINMKDKHYSPSVLTINAGDKVLFNNMDAIKHNVFSSSGNNAFDLGTYGLGIKQGVALKHQGIVKVYCNIHVQMATFIAVNDNSYAFVTNDDGKFQLSGLPVGEYLVKVWNVRGETVKRIRIEANETAVSDITLNATAYEAAVTHLNKFGKSYKVEPTLFKDEFY